MSCICGCNGGDVFACNNLGYMYASGIHDAHKNPFNAVRYLNIACEVGVLSSCNNLATFYKKEQGCEDKSKKAMELYGLA